MTVSYILVVSEKKSFENVDDRPRPRPSYKFPGAIGSGELNIDGKSCFLLIIYPFTIIVKCMQC